MIGDPERNVVKAVFYYPVAHTIRSILCREYNRKMDQNTPEIDDL
jgi:hypothetical protein